MTSLNLLRFPEPGSHARILFRARLAHSLTSDAQATALRNAVLAMKAETRAEGVALGLTMCDDDDCPHEATHTWTRSQADLKGMRRKHKGTWLAGQPESIRCETHVPGWLAAKYQPFGRRAEQIAA